MSISPDVGEWPSDTLPRNWSWASFVDVWSDNTDSNRKIPRKEYSPSGLLPVIDQGEEYIGGFCNDRNLRSLTPLPSIVWGDHTRCVKYLDQAFVQGADGVKVLTPTQLLYPRFGYFALRAIKIPDKGYSRHFKFLRASEFPLPPLNEQRRIVDKLDSLFERTRRAREELAHIPRLIENYKKAILEAAFRGDLTKDWRASHSGASVNADARDTDNRCRPLPELPSAWGWGSVAGASIVSGGLTKNARRRDIENKVPYLRVANVYANELRLEEVQEIGCTPAEYEKTRLCLGDLLVVEGNGSIDQIGRVGLDHKSAQNPVVKMDT